MNKFALTVIFDENYIEPALVTICDLVRFIPEDFDCVLIFIQSIDDEVNGEASRLIEEVVSKNRNKIKRNINAISLKPNVFDDFNKFHFTSSILYKLILPQVLDYEYILNVDAGYLSGGEASHLFEYCRRITLSPKFIASSVAALCTTAENDLSLELKVYDHHQLYPAGGIFLFNVTQYENQNLYYRLLANYNIYKNLLIWAEQDLLCLTALKEELFEIKFEKLILIEQLSIQDYVEQKRPVQDVSEFMLYKITGTLKPWKYWVLDAKKLFYIRRRNEVLSDVNITDYQLIKNNRFKITHAPLYHAFLELHETQLLLK
jgi:lipopolysaccharide biosynthesis glycosyltransferase